MVPAFRAFVRDMAAKRYDAFVIAVRLPAPATATADADADADVHAFGAVVRRVLTAISDADPHGARCMRKSYIHRSFWNFSFAGHPFFVTSFAPCYARSHSRYVPRPADGNAAFDPRIGFVLLQPEASFEHRKLPFDTPETNWGDGGDGDGGGGGAAPTVRDRVRRAFRDRGCPYEIPASVSYPTAHHVVKPLRRGDPVVEWWKRLLGGAPACG